MRDLIEPYNDQWKKDFEALRGVYLYILEGACMDIQHVGSTAIPGLCGKPILDIDIIIDDEDLLPMITERLEMAGYDARGDQGIPGRYAFRQCDPTVPWTNPRRTWQEHHLYVCLQGSLALKNHLRFRDMLLANPALADAYGLFKMELAHRPDMDRPTYSRSKTAFILDTLSGAGFSPGELRQIEEANR
jgi:GrpB-like predicted nucleotidyltransferase (UPF0157 family)